MPATVSYVKIVPQCSIPIRVFINRKRIMLSNRVAINEKSIIKLSSINLLRLSNNDLAKLISEIALELREVLLQIPLRDLFPKRSLQKNTKLSRDIGDNWRCKLVVSIGYIANLRYKLGYLRDAGDIRFLEEKNITVSGVEVNKTCLLTKDIKFSFGETVDDKKGLSYKLHKLTLVNNSIVDSLDLFVVQRPR